VNHTEVFAPFLYSTLSDIQKYDVALIEGFIGTVPSFISTLRSMNPDILILHYCLDTYPHIDDILSLDVDAFLTNSHYMASTVLPSHGFKAHHMNLAVDPSVFLPSPSSPPSSPNPFAGIDIVYVGQYSPNKSNLLMMLTEAAEFAQANGKTFAIYGHAWTRSDDPKHLLPYWRGILPFDALSDLYSSVPVVLGTTESKQVSGAREERASAITLLSTRAKRAQRSSTAEGSERTCRKEEAVPSFSWARSRKERFGSWARPREIRAGCSGLAQRSSTAEAGRERPSRKQELVPSFSWARNKS
jgi:hypothetical protein